MEKKGSLTYNNKGLEPFGLKLPEGSDGVEDLLIFWKSNVGSHRKADLKIDKNRIFNSDKHIRHRHVRADLDDVSLFLSGRLNRRRVGRGRTN